jgi:hypothetical protein
VAKKNKIKMFVYLSKKVVKKFLKMRLTKLRY